MFCLLNNPSFDAYVLATFHYAAMAALFFGIYKLVTTERKARD